jgi:hypothetical protein
MGAALHSIVRLMPFNLKANKLKVEPPLGTDCVQLSRVHCTYILAFLDIEGASDSTSPDIKLFKIKISQNTSLIVKCKLASLHLTIIYVF